MVVKGDRRPRRGEITTEAVIATALAIVDGAGVEALTIRRLAADCGLSPMAIYRHVRDKDELLDRVVDEVAASIGEAPTTGPWNERLVALLEEARRVLLDHPGAALVAITRSTPGPAVARFYDRVLAVLDDAGLDDGHTVLLFDALLMFLFGSVLWQSPRPPAARRPLLRLAAVLDPPPVHLLAHAAELGERDPDRYFRFGIETIIRNAT